MDGVNTDINEVNQVFENVILTLCVFQDKHQTKPDRFPINKETGNSINSINRPPNSYIKISTKTAQIFLKDLITCNIIFK